MSTAPRPPSTLPHIDVNALPAELRLLPRFVAWAFEWDDEREDWTKVPKNPRSGRNAMADRPSTWGSLDRALSCTGFDGIGMEFGTGEGPYFGIDLDGCADGEGNLVEEAARIVTAFKGCYVEWSPSRRGVHIIGRGRLPDRRGDGRTGRRTKGRGFKQIEAYDRLRYFTLTGWPLDGSSSTIGEAQAALDTLVSDYFGAREPKRRRRAAGSAEGTEPLGDFADDSVPLDDDALLSRMFAAKNGDKARRLWDGDTSGYASPSEADQALLCVIAFWTRDAGQIERVFARSQLAKRGKWSERSDYRECSVAAALAFTEGRSRFDGSKGKARRAPPDLDGEPSAAWPRIEGQHGLAVEVRQARSTRGGKWTFRGRLLVGDKDAGPVEGGCSSSGREALAKAIVELARDADLRLEGEAREDVRRFVRRVLDPDVLADLRIELDRREAKSPNALLPPATVAAEHLKDALALAFRDPNGDLWSETEERALRVHDLQVLGGEGLRDALLTRANSFQHVDDLDAYALLRATETCARAAYGNLRSLPTETRAELGAESAAAKRHRGEVLFAIDSHEQRVGTHRPAGGYGEWRSSTLAGAVRDLHDKARRQLPDDDEALPWPREWRRVHGGYALAARFRLEDDGLVHIELAVRAEILRQTRTPNPNRPPDAWVQLGRTYECIEPDECRVEGARWHKLTARMLAALDLKPLPPIDERRRSMPGSKPGNTKGPDAGARQTKPPASTTEGARRCSACKAELAADRWGGLCFNCYESRKLGDKP